MKKVIAVVVVILAGVCFAESPRHVEVVAEVGLTKQTGTATGTLYTPSETGVFRVNFMTQCTSGGSGTVEPRLSWVDDNGGEFYPTSATVPCEDPHTPVSFIFIIKAIAGQPITWTVFGGLQGENIFEVYIALEQIGPKVQ
jgi:hypothetical protein